jgi:AcrR family transcriptional regulator
VTDHEPDWRQRKKSATRDRIRASALRLFREYGYDATTVEQIAAAAGVSHMTFFRYFPAKEDVALSDSFDPLIAGAIAQTPASWPLTRRIRTVFVQGLRQIYPAERDTLLAQNKLIISTPALRERLWASQIATQQLILQALGKGQDDPQPSFQDRVTVAACLAAATTAILTWVENDGVPELPDLIDQAFDTLTHPRYLCDPRIVVRVHVLEADRADGRHLRHVFARFRPVEVTGAAGQDHDGAWRVGLQLLFVELVTQADVENTGYDRIDPVFVVPVRHQLDAGR